MALRVLHFIAALTSGGAERQLELILGQSERQKLKFGVAYLREGSDQYSYLENVDYFRVPKIYTTRPIEYCRFIDRLFDTWKPEIVHLWMPEVITVPAALSAKMRRIPIISALRGSMRVSGSVWQKIRDRLNYPQHFLANKVVSNFDVAMEPQLLRKLFQLRNGVVVPNAIYICSAESTASLDINLKNVEAFKLWFTGRFVPEKRLDMLVEAVKMLRSVHRLNISLHIAGNGAESETRRLAQKVSDLGLTNSVFFVGYRSDWHNMAKQADLLVLPSVSEGMSNVIIESMAIGLPVLAADIPENKNILAHGETGLLFAADDVNALVSQIQRLYLSRQQLAAIAANAMRKSEQYSTAAMIKSYNAIYFAADKNR